MVTTTPIAIAAESEEPDPPPSSPGEGELGEEPGEEVGAEPGEGVGETQLPPPVYIAPQKSEPLKQQPEADDASFSHEHWHVGAQVQLLQTLLGYAAPVTKSTAAKHFMSKDTRNHGVGTEPTTKPKRTGRGLPSAFKTAKIGRESGKRPGRRFVLAGQEEEEEEEEEGPNRLPWLGQGGRAAAGCACTAAALRC
jgi:hypothetical protein